MLLKLQEVPLGAGEPQMERLRVLAAVGRRNLRGREGAAEARKETAAAMARERERELGMSQDQNA